MRIGWIMQVTLVVSLWLWYATEGGQIVVNALARQVCSTALWTIAVLMYQRRDFLR